MLSNFSSLIWSGNLYLILTSQEIIVRLLIYNSGRKVSFFNKAREENSLQLLGTLFQVSNLLRQKKHIAESLHSSFYILNICVASFALFENTKAHHSYVFVTLSYPQMFKSLEGSKLPQQNASRETSSANCLLVN